jgi:arylsulfatase A
MGIQITRRQFIKGVGVVGVGLIAARVIRDVRGRDYDPQRTQNYFSSINPPQNTSELPNIILILVDDLGYGDIGAFGSQVIHTPHLDQMAAEGVRLTNFHAAAPVCSPSRAGLLTGRYPIRTHISLPLYPTGHPMQLFLSAIDRYRFDVNGIPEDEALLPEILSRRGYHTGMVGKWHLGDRSGHIPNDRGFDSFYGVLYSNDVKPFALYRDREIVEASPVDQSTLTQKYTREAIKFIEENRTKPFFLYLSHTAVHEPLFASEQFRGSSQAGLYGDDVEEVDASTGEILAKLQELGIDQNTLVIFTSDNGPWWQGSPGEYRGRKTNMMEGGFKVPFIARWPGKLTEGMTSDALSVNFDILPTCLGIAGLALADDRIIDGRDLMPLLQGDPTPPHDTFFYFDGPHLVAVQHKGWKYHRRHMSDNGGYPAFSQGPFLFNLSTDPSESYSLLESEPEMAKKLSGMLDEFDQEIDENVRGWL